MRALIIAFGLALLPACAEHGNWVRSGTTTAAAPEDVSACDDLARRVAASGAVAGPASASALRFEGNSPLGSSLSSLPTVDAASGDPQAVFRTCMRQRGYEVAPPTP